MIQMSVSELANLKTKKWTIPIFHGLRNQDSSTNVWKVHLEPLEPCCRACSREFQPTDGLCPDGEAVPLIYRGSS